MRQEVKEKTMKRKLTLKVNYSIYLINKSIHATLCYHLGGYLLRLKNKIKLSHLLLPSKVGRILPLLLLFLNEATFLLY